LSHFRSCSPKFQCLNPYAMYTRASCSRCRNPMWLSREDAAVAGEFPKCRRCIQDLQRGECCPICLDLFTEPVSFSRVSNESWDNSSRCEHRFCRECLRMYIRSKLEDGAWNMRCPAVACKYMLLDSDLRKVLVLPGINSKLPLNIDDKERTAQQQEGVRLLETYRGLRCADFGAHLQEILAAAESRIQEKTTREDEDQEREPGFRDWARVSCQACPTCRVIVRKETGCNHIQCRCGTSFCYGCGAPSESNACICRTKGAEELPQLARWLKWKNKI